MNYIGYEIKKSDAVLAAVKIAKTEVCPVLACISYYEKDGKIAAGYDLSGLSSFEELLRSKKFIDISLLLTYLRSTLESAGMLSDYLISSDQVSFSVDRLFFDQGKRAVFLIDDSPGNYTQKMLQLLDEIQMRFPECNAGLIAKKIKEENSEKLFGFKSILSMLSAWQMELR